MAKDKWVIFQINPPHTQRHCSYSTEIILKVKTISVSSIICCFSGDFCSTSYRKSVNTIKSFSQCIGLCKAIHNAGNGAILFKVCGTFTFLHWYYLAPQYLVQLIDHCSFVAILILVKLWSPHLLPSFLNKISLSYFF